jgi:transcription initiation factor TFIID subunit 7
LKKLTADLDMKLAQRDEMKEQQMRKKEGIVLEDPDSEPEAGVNEGEGEADAPDGDLFGSDDPAIRMDVD